MWNRASDSDPEEDLFVEELGGSLAALRRGDCPDPRMLPALGEGVLPEEEAARVSAHVDRCECCRQLASHMAAVQEADSTPEARERILARVRRAANAGRPQRRWSKAGTLSRWMLVPAAAAAALWLVLGPAAREEVPRSLGPTRQEVAVQRAPVDLAALIPLDKAPIELPVEALLTRRAEPDDYYSALVAALIPYNEGRYEEAGLKVREVTERHPARAEAQFYLGVCDLMQGKAGDAIVRLETADRLAEETLKRMTGWYLAQAYLQASDAEMAEGRLKPLCASAGDYQQRACAALKRLDEVRKE